MRGLPTAWSRRARVVIATATLATSGVAVGQPSPAAASALKPPGCIWTLGYLPQVSEVMKGDMALPGGGVNIGTGKIPWATIAAQHSVTWDKNFMSLSWTLSAVHMYVLRGEASYMLPYLDRAEQIAADFLAHVPVGGGPMPAATWSAMYAGQRADVFGCLASLDPAFTPAVRALKAMGPWLANPAHDPGNWNQGVDFRLGGLATGCITGNTTWATLARDKLGTLAAAIIDPQGAPYEQSVSYGSRLVTVFGDAITQLTNCFGTAASVIGSRVAALQRFLAWARQPDGGLPVLGDSSEPASGSACGASGPIPLSAQPGTSKVFTAGYAFGRTSWTPDPAKPVTTGYYSLRFGRGRVMHGHDDHQSITWNADNNSLLIDPGSSTHLAAFAAYDRLPQAHNVLTEPGVAFNEGAATTLVRSRTRTAWQSYELADTAYGGRARVRDVLFDLTAGIVVVEDRASRTAGGGFTQLWHVPADAAVSVGRTGVASTTRCPGTTMWLVPLPLRGQAIALHSTGVVKGATSPYQGWSTYESAGVVKPAPVVVLRRAGTTARVLTVLTVGSSRTQPRITRTWSTTEGYVYTISNSGVTRHIRLDNSGMLTEV